MLAVHPYSTLAPSCHVHAQMLEAAEAEVFGQGGSDVAEAKPTAPERAYFKSSKGVSTTDGEQSTMGSASSAQSKPTRESAGAAGAFKPARSEGEQSKWLIR